MTAEEKLECPKCTAFIEVTADRCWNCETPLQELKARFPAFQESAVESEGQSVVEDDRGQRGASPPRASALGLELSSGTRLDITHVFLVPEPHLQEVYVLRTKAQQELAGFSSGIGFWGSTGWVLAGAAITRAVESIVSGAKAKDGIQLLLRAGE